MSNAPDRFALFMLLPGEKRVEIKEDTRIPNAVTVTLHKEDHTLGNMIRQAVLSQPGIMFCGYKVPHPLEPRVQIRIQTNGEQTPVQVLQTACEKLITQIDDVRTQFKQQVLAQTGGLGSGAAVAGIPPAARGAPMGAGYGRPQAQMPIQYGGAPYGVSPVGVGYQPGRTDRAGGDYLAD
ncbi:RBP11-like subunits of RNA polymerase [Tilletiaria anomala UBC 951]|uniref:RBP11-like subunits of RNA polymerase n=1 Tax=Tilletiaria anomala (strain ATCC 24038 / CBS 436.72 / UBC 951) TaxID=1037660 RepID=A0A066VPY6_TILAU|nr:RBP11-like subunits of RNA polymerase [Tilletiaria anomala UBC 951]KDN43546.1 RBP11-like subunits of RNA polymerase [Tilletiaria anomala UBC 951]